MVSTFTPNIHAELIGTGDLAGTWGSELNAAVFTIIDNVLGAVQTISLSSTDVMVTTTQSQVNFIKLTGTLTANVNVIFPAIGRTYFIQNATTGSFTVTLKISTGVVIPQGTTGIYVLDGSNVQSFTPLGIAGLANFGGANNAIYSTSSTQLAAATLPKAAGGTGVTTGAFVTVNVQKFTSSGTYTPSAGLLYAIVECIGCGGGGGGAQQNSGSNINGAGGGSGGYSRVTVSASAIGASQAVTIGSPGVGGAAGNHDGTSGGAVSLGVLCVANGGGGGGASSSAKTGTAGAGAAAGTGDIAAPGNAGGSGQGFNNAVYSGFGAGSFYGGAVASSPGANGSAGSSPGGGGSGGQANASTNLAGGNGATGICVVTEYLNQ